MDIDFLKDFNLRMKKLGAYALICKNSMFKNSWKNYGFAEDYEYLNLIFSVLLYIMEQSLKDENCTIDDIASFIDDINVKYLGKPMNFEECKTLGEFVANTILCDDGKAMYFKGYSFEEAQYKEIHISFVANKIVYINDVVKRTSYHLTEDGYSLLLSTLEIENNLKLTIHEMIFKLHLEKATYDKAVDDIKNIFNIIRMQLQKMQEAIRRIRENALNYSADEYRSMLEGNMTSLYETRKKFNNYKEHVDERIKEINEKDIHIKKLNDKEKENLKFLGIISKYLTRTIEEQQKLLNTHFDFKNIYSKELKDISSMALIKRFNINTEIYEKVLSDSSKLENIDEILRPLFRAKISKKYNINKCLQYQKTIKGKEEEEDEIISFDDDEWAKEKEEKARQKILNYKKSLKMLLQIIYEHEKMSLNDISQIAKEEKKIKELLIPTAEIFREIIIELLKAKEIYLEELKLEKTSTLTEGSQMQFQLNEVLLEIIEEEIDFSDIKNIYINKLVNKDKVKFYEVNSDKGKVKSVVCSDVFFKIEK